MKAKSGRGAARGWLWPVLLMMAIFVASSASEVPAPDMVDIDKVAHALVFGLLATTIARTQPLHRMWLGAVGASLYGIADEFRQSFTPGRSVEVADWVADTIGAVLAVLVYRYGTIYRNLLEWRVRAARQQQVATEQNPVPEKAA